MRVFIGFGVVVHFATVCVAISYDSTRFPSFRRAPKDFRTDTQHGIKKARWHP